MSCNSSDRNLPIIQLTISKYIFEALLDTSANLSLMQPHVINMLKNEMKLNFLSRSVNIQTIDNNSVIYFSTMDLKFQTSGFQMFSSLPIITGTQISK